MFGFNPNKINVSKTEKIETTPKPDPQELFALAKEESFAIDIKPEDRNSKGDLLVYPGGPVSNLEEQYWKLVRTPSFKKWFGKSDIVDENGEPALVFHSTNDNIDDFISFSVEAAREKKREKDLLNKGTVFTLSETEDVFYFTAGNRKYGRNKLSVFVNAKTKKMNTRFDMIWKEKGYFNKFKKQGYTGLVLYFDDVQNEIDMLKKEFRRTYAPKNVMDKIFFGFKKITDIEEQIRGLFDREKSESLKNAGRDKLKEIQFEARRLNKDKSQTKARFFEVLVFEPDQIMVVNKEKEVE